ncbi:MAG TPA: nucleotidyltransferase domain-containing protein [bacterium]|jgi:predicted nucleotidyltransferase
MVDFESIQQVCDQIAREFHPQKIILFGSYAYGTPHDDSDVDLLVVLPEIEGNPIRKAAQILQHVSHRFAIDLLVRTPEVIRQRIEWEDFFLREIMERGTVLYEADTDGPSATPLNSPTEVGEQRTLTSAAEYDLRRRIH